MYFSVSLNKTKKRPMKQSSLSFKLHKNERPEKEKGFYAHIFSLQQSIESSSNLAPVSRLCQMGGLSIASVSWLFPLSLYSTNWLLFRSSMAFGVCFVESMLPSHTIWRANKFEDCLPWVYQLSSPLHHFPCVSPTLITTSSTLVLCWLMKDTSMPSFNGFLPIDFNTSSGNEI